MESLCHTTKSSTARNTKLQPRKKAFAAAKMDPERVRGYLQVACAGLGFDIGEIWWTQNETGTSTLATIGELLPPFSSEVSPATCHDTAFN
jgi:hypothetical protein